VLYKPFLATAAVWLDSAARCCGLRLRFCVRKTCPATGTRPPSMTPRQDTAGNKFRIELDKQVLDNRRVAGELLLRPAGSQHQGFANTGNRTGGQGGCPFEKEDRYHHLVARQSEIKEKLGPHEKPGTEPSGRRRHGRLRGQFRETKQNKTKRSQSNRAEGLLFRFEPQSAKINLETA